METLRTPSRLHFSLIDMHGGLGRVDGGIGVALEEPGFEISFSKSSLVSGVENEARKLAEKLCSSLGVGGVDIKIKEKIPEHIGFGSSTQLYLAIASGICKAYGIKKSVRELAEMVGRGGTSGIGVAAFEEGGFVLDGGHPAEKGFIPSRFSKAEPAPVLARHDFPWWLVCAWPNAKGAYGLREKNIFKKKCPIPSKEVEVVSRLVLMKILPAIAEKDIDNFGEGITAIQKTGFKKIEVSLQTTEVKNLITYLQKNSAGGGMSSFGPVCFGLCESKSEAQALASGLSFNSIITKANNNGAKWL